ncbi:hypothetical protein MRX96_004410 [Rhipicephalus microplus]
MCADALLCQLRQKKKEREIGVRKSSTSGRVVDTEVSFRRLPRFPSGRGSGEGASVETNDSSTLRLTGHPLRVLLFRLKKPQPGELPLTSEQLSQPVIDGHRAILSQESAPARGYRVLRPRFPPVTTGWHLFSARPPGNSAASSSLTLSFVFIFILRRGENARALEERVGNRRRAF